MEFRGGAVRINTILDALGNPFGPCDFCLIDNQNWSNERDEEDLFCAGESTPLCTVVNRIRQSFRGQVCDFEQLCKLNSIACGASGGDIEMFLRQCSPKPLDFDQPVHRVYEIAFALIYWSTLTMNSGQKATADLVLDAYLPNGAVQAEPITCTDGVIIPDDIAGRKSFTLGPMVCFGELLDCLQSITINNNYEFEPDDCGSGKFQDARGIQSAKTEIVVRSKTVKFGKEIPACGVPVENVQFYSQAQKFATTAPEHILWTIPQGTAYPNTTSSDGRGKVSDEFVIKVEGGEADSLQCQTGQVIPV